MNMSRCRGGGVSVSGGSEERCHLVDMEVGWLVLLDLHLLPSSCTHISSLVVFFCLPVLPCSGMGGDDVHIHDLCVVPASHVRIEDCVASGLQDDLSLRVVR